MQQHAEVPNETRIKEILTNIQKTKAELKEVKKSIRNEKKNEDEDYLELKKKIKELNKATKQMQFDFEKGLNDSNDYVVLVEMKNKIDEKLANQFLELQNAVNILPHAPIQLTIETELGKMLANINPEMKVYVNGKEEKRN